MAKPLGTTFAHDPAFWQLASDWAERRYPAENRAPRSALTIADEHAAEVARIEGEAFWALAEKHGHVESRKVFGKRGL